MAYAATTFQRNSFQNNAFQIGEGLGAFQPGAFQNNAFQVDTQGAFEADAFQNNAFQVGPYDPAAVPTIGLGGPTLSDIFPTYSLSYPTGLTRRTN